MGARLQASYWRKWGWLLAYQGESVWKGRIMIKEKRRKKAKRKKKLAVFFIFICILAILAVAAVKGFTLKEVKVSGNELYSDRQIKESVLNDEYSWNTLYVVLKYKLFKMQEIPFIDEMEVSLATPHTIHVKVYEKATIGYIEANNQNVYFDRDGFVVEISKRLIEDVPKVEGLECKEVVVYEKLNLEDEDALSLLLTFSQQLQKYELRPDTIVFRTNNSLTAVFGKIRAEIGDSEYLVEKAMRLNAIMPKLSGKKGTLHLENWTPLATDVIFEPAK